jgi:wyosine [tRNA(Phe)-imidazoG37] synthetase (radical SAM superfamily)
MLVRGVNDSLVEITKLQEVVKKIEPDKIHLNTVVRPPSEEYASPLLIAELIKIKEYFGDKCEIIAEFKGKKEGLYSPNKEDQILNVIKRRPVTADDIYNVTSLHMNEILKYLDKLQKDKKIRLTEHKGREYFEIP